MDSEKLRSLLIWLVPVAISLCVVFIVHSRSQKFSSRDFRVSFDPIFTLLLPLLLWYVSHPFLFGFLVKRNNKSSEEAIQTALLSFHIHLVLFFVFCLLHKSVHSTPNILEFLFYWIRAGLFFNLTMAMIQLLPRPPFLGGCLLFHKKRIPGSYWTGFALTFLLLVIIPPDSGFGRMLFPVYHFIINTCI